MKLKIKADSKTGKATIQYGKKKIHLSGADVWLRDRFEEDFKDTGWFRHCTSKRDGDFNVFVLGKVKRVDAPSNVIQFRPRAVGAA